MELFNLIMRFVSIIYSYSLSNKLKVCKNYLYTIWIRQFIYEVGYKSYLCYPIRLQGDCSSRISIGNRTQIQSYSILGCWKKSDNTENCEPEIIIGNNCNIGEFCHITSINRISIGNGLLTGRFVYIGDNSHGGLSWDEANIPPIKRKLQSKGEIVIGDNVWIGDKVTILAGVHIGNNVIIGANSVVNSDIPSNSVAAGIPAKILKQL